MSVIAPETIIAKCTADPWCRMVSYGGTRIIKLGEVPEWFMNISQNMPDGSPERAAYADAAEKARQIYADQVRVVFDPVTLDVKALCVAEPWLDRPLTEISDGAVYGFVTEKLERAVALIPAGTEEHRFYQQAHKTAVEIYFDQIKADSRAFANGRSKESIDHARMDFWSRANRYEYQNNYIRARLGKVCELICHYFEMDHPDYKPRHGGQRMVVRDKFSSGPE